MNTQGEILLSVLRDVYKVPNNFSLTKKLKVRPNNIKGLTTLSKTVLKNVIQAVYEKEHNRINGDHFIAYGKKKYKKKTDYDMAQYLGFSQPAISIWKNKGLTIRSIYEVLKKSKNEHTNNLLNPIIEFYPVDRTKLHKSYNVINKSSKVGEKLAPELEKHYGVYVFHDSQGRTVYVGKAKKQSLWKEINLAYNRKRGDAQIVKRVTHLKSTSKKFDPGKEKNRHIVSQKVYLHDICVYFSAYSVEKSFIDNLEASIIRMFPNDLLNSKVEKLSSSRKLRVKKKHKH